MILKPLADPKSVAQKGRVVPLETQLITREDQIMASLKNRLERLTLELKTKLTIKFCNKQKDIRVIYQPTDSFSVRCDESLSVASISAYLTNSFYDLLIKTEGHSLDESYFLIKKVQAIIQFCRSNIDKPSFENEAIFARANELVFLQNNYFFELFVARFLDFMRYLKTLGPKLKRFTSGMLQNKAEVEHNLQGKLIALKVKTKALFSIALMYSDQKQHDSAINNALKALGCGYSILQITMCLVLYKLTRQVQKMRVTTDESKMDKILKKRAYYGNVGCLLTSLLARIDSLPGLIKKSSKVTAALAFFSTYYTETDKEAIQFTEEDIDLGFLNNPDVINSSLLKDSTILHLTNMNYMSFGHEIDTDLSEEVGERGILDKVANIAVAFYILSVEHRFNEHNSFTGARFYKSLLDYFNPELIVKGSDFFLTKAVELSYLYLSDSFPFVSQILLVFKNFELNRSKHIPENGEETEIVRYLHPFKNGFKSGLVIPVIRRPMNAQLLTKSEITKDKTVLEREFVSEKMVARNFDKDPQSLIRKIYVPNKKTTVKVDKVKMPTAVMRSPDLTAQKQLQTIKLKVFKGATLSNPPSDREMNSESLTSSALLCGAASAVGASPVVTVKTGNVKVKRGTDTTAKIRVGSSKITSNKENEVVQKTEKRANSSEINRAALKDSKPDKRSSQIKIPAKAAPKTEFSLLKSTEFMFNDQLKKVALKLKSSNNENLDHNKKTAVLGQLRPNTIDKKISSIETIPVGESLSKDASGNVFFLQQMAQKTSPLKSSNGFKISHNPKAPQTVYFQNFIKNKNNIAEILSKFK